MSVLVWTGVVLLGGVGAVLRFLLDGAVGRRVDTAFPLGTLVVNLSGAVLLGLVTGLALDQDAALLAGAATIGAYTTFSTWMLETHRLGEQRQNLFLAANIVLSLVAGVAAAAAGMAIGAAW